MREIGGILLALVAAVVLAVSGLAFGGFYLIDRPTCYAHWANSGYAVRWSLWGDCQISEDGKVWMTDDAYIALHKQVKVTK